MRGLGILMTLLVLGLSGCGAAGTIPGSAGSSHSTTPPSRAVSTIGSTSGSATTQSSALTVTISSGQTSSRVAIKIPNGAATPSQSQALATEIHQLNQLLTALQHP